MENEGASPRSYDRLQRSALSPEDRHSTPLRFAQARLSSLRSLGMTWVGRDGVAYAGQPAQALANVSPLKRLVASTSARSVASRSMLDAP